MAITLIIADDHPLVVAGLRNLFAQEEDFRVLAHCNDGSSTIQAVKEHQPDIVILDILMPGKGGLEIVRELRELNLHPKIVLFTATISDELLLQAILLGVQGIVLKEMASHLLVQCIRKVYAGEQWLERRSANVALEKIMRKESGSRRVAAVLTPREIELVKLISLGSRNKEIAEKLCISVGTVKVHLHNIYEKLNVNGRLALLRYAREKDLE
ncbi:response regulator [Pelotalea chapellei]|uniref:Response regulator transcription factor n=1 Tax=Pelotalea chapellei TaxID=44671 RepID=A0ABS5UCD6_9BACT|nr:response regulator transcription factor [Pelotalea chapellei]MBT1073334.1 response regulator transcription factor [Pelotalea chapellei]